MIELSRNIIASNKSESATNAGALIVGSMMNYKCFKKYCPMKS